MLRALRLSAFVFVVAVAVALIWWFGPRAQQGPDKSAAVAHYADIAHAAYTDSLKKARELRDRIDAFLAEPSSGTLQAAREAWRAARVPYMQTEAYRFGNPVVDQWEAQVNAWPLDEGLIDYVADGYVHEQANPAARANLIASRELQAGGRTIDVSDIEPSLLADLNEIGGSEANVATGYHAIEFLLWGQDLNGTGPGAGERPYTDYVAGKGACTDGPETAPVRHCERRRAYLRAATELLIRDLRAMVEEWERGGADNYRRKLIALPGDEALRRMLFGMGSLALGELAGERMKVALLAHSTEDEHDCFSDNTHVSHYYDLIGIRNVYRGTYERVDGTTLDGPGIRALLRARAPEAARDMTRSLDRAERAVGAIYEAAENGEHFDQMIAGGNAEGNRRIRKALDALVALAGSIQNAAGELGVRNLRPDTAGHQF